MDPLVLQNVNCGWEAEGASNSRLSWLDAHETLVNVV
jgi:hypothetical protein